MTPVDLQSTPNHKLYEIYRGLQTEKKHTKTPATENSTFIKESLPFVHLNTFFFFITAGMIEELQSKAGFEV